MLLALVCLITAAAAAPVHFDQRQDGELNVSADVQNIVFVLAIPHKASDGGIFDDFLKSNQNRERHSNAQERADHMNAFVEPATPYKVEIGVEHVAESDARVGEVVIAGRKKSGVDTKAEPEAESEADELKLLGATEQCGPDRERDPDTLACRPRAPAQPQNQPETQKQPEKEEKQPEIEEKQPETQKKQSESEKRAGSQKQPESQAQPQAADEKVFKSKEPTPEVVSS